MRKSVLKKFLFVVIDAIIAFCATLVAWAFFNDNPVFGEQFFAIGASYVFFLIIVYYVFKVYNILWRFATLNDYIRLTAATFISTIASWGSMLAIGGGFEFDNKIAFIMFIMTYMGSFIFRLTFKHHNKDPKKIDFNISGNIMVIGAGSAGSLIINDIFSNDLKHDCDIRCIIDDDVSKHGKYINGVKIVGGTDEIVAAAKEYKIDLIVFAIPTCPSNRKSAILKICQKTECKLKVIPAMYQLLSDDNLNTSSLRNVEIEDLLGREPININVESVMNYVENRVVMVTGGGGSIGSELCRQIAVHNPKQLIIFDIYENNAYDIQLELLRNHPELNLVTLIGSVRDKARLESVFKKYQPEIVYHAAAHKHVPLMEDSPNESIKNNVFGTLNTARFADKYNVQKFVLISTDKAVNPTNIMGASKRICEMIVQTYNNHSETEFVAVRFGNVLGSNGSVIPLFKKQIAEGGPVTVTDPNIIRYFMTIPEAVSLVLQAGASANGGEIFVLDMGEPVKILDLAENLISLSGYKPYIDIKISFTGLRPGEKLYEEKLLSEEGLMRTSNSLIHIGHPIEIDEEKFTSVLTELESVMADDNCDIRALVKSIVPTYTYTENKKGDSVKA